MTDEQKPLSTGRRSFIKEIVGGAFTLIGAILAIRHDKREQEKHEWARADRQQGQVVEIGTAHEINGAGRLTVSSPTLKGSGTVAPPDPTIPI